MYKKDVDQLIELIWKMKGLVILLFLQPLVGAITYYDNYKVYRVTPTSMDEALALKTFESNAYFDFWSNLRTVDAPVDIMVNPLAQDMFENFLQTDHIEYEIIIENVEETIDRSALSRASTRAVEQGKVSFTQFMTYNEITAYLQQLATDYPSIVTTEVVGKSFEGRNIQLIKISSGGSNKTTIFIEATIHAREWIAPPVALYVISQLVENPENAYMYEDVDWAIIPVINPDGYEYTHSTTRLWRKTRTPGTICYGVDANRNFDFYWRVIGASSWQCDQTYAGYTAFSEKESQAIRDYTLAHKDDIKLYVAVHSYGQWMLYPWGHTTDSPDNEEELVALGMLFRDAVYAVNNTQYVVNSTAKGLYYAAGGSMDWAKAVAGIELTYTIELPGGGNAGFNIPADRIESVVQETWEGFKVLHEYIARKFKETETN